MRKVSLLLIMLFFAYSVILIAGTKEKGEKCFSDTQCKFGLECHEGVCIKKKAYDYGSSGKTGDPCQIDADCIGSGTCVKGSFGKKYCSG